jgi:hypothetical protein
MTKGQRRSGGQSDHRQVHLCGAAEALTTLARAEGPVEPTQAIPCGAGEGSLHSGTASMGGKLTVTSKTTNAY